MQVSFALEKEPHVSFESGYFFVNLFLCAVDCCVPTVLGDISPVRGLAKRKTVSPKWR